MENLQLTFKEILPVALPRFQSRLHSVHTTLKTPRKPMANAIRLLLLTQAQKNSEGLVQKSNTQFLPENKPHAQKLLTQFFRHLPTHHPEIEMNRIIMPSMKKSESLKNSSERKEARMAWHYIQRAVWHNGGFTSLESW
jgi:hypothetical protein